MPNQNSTDKEFAVTATNEVSSLSSILAQKPRITEADTDSLNDKAGDSDESFNTNFNQAVKNISGFTVKPEPKTAAAGHSD